MSKLNKKSRSDPRSRGSRGAGGRGANNTNNQSQTRNNRQQRPERSGNLFLISRIFSAILLFYFHCLLFVLISRIF